MYTYNLMNFVSYLNSYNVDSYSSIGADTAQCCVCNRRHCRTVRMEDYQSHDEERMAQGQASTQGSSTSRSWVLSWFKGT